MTLSESHREGYEAPTPFLQALAGYLGGMTRRRGSRISVLAFLLLVSRHVMMPLTLSESPVVCNASEKRPSHATYLGKVMSDLFGK